MHAVAFVWVEVVKFSIFLPHGHLGVGGCDRLDIFDVCEAGWRMGLTGGRSGVGSIIGKTELGLSDYLVCKGMMGTLSFKVMMAGVGNCGASDGMLC